MKTRSSIRSNHQRTLLTTLTLGATLVAAPLFAASSTPGQQGPRTGTSATDSRSSANPAGTQDTSSTSATTRSQTGAQSEVSRRDREFLEKAAKHGMTEVQASQAAVTRAQHSQVRQYAQQLVSDHQKANTQLASIASQRGVNIALSQMGAASGSMAGTGSSRTTPSTTPGTASGTGGSARTGESAGAGAGMGTSSGTSVAGAGSRDTSATGTTSGRTAAKEVMPDDDKLQDLLQKSGQEFDRAYLELMVDGHRESIDIFESAERSQDPEIKQFASSQLPTLRQHLQQARDLQRTVREGSATGTRTPDTTRERSGSTTDTPGSTRPSSNPTTRP